MLLGRLGVHFLRHQQQINNIIIQLRKEEYKYAGTEYNYPAILYGYINSWLLCVVKIPF